MSSLLPPLPLNAEQPPASGFFKKLFNKRCAKIRGRGWYFFGQKNVISRLEKQIYRLSTPIFCSWMRLYKIVDTLKKLSPKQLSRLDAFIHSPYFNENDTITAIFCYLKSLHPGKLNNVDSAAIMKKVKGLPDEKELTRKISALLDLTEKFLSLEYSSDQFMERIGTVRAYKKLQLPRHFESAAQQLRRELDEQKFYDFDYWWRMHRLEEEAFEGFDKVIVRTQENPGAEVFESLKRFYLTKKLRYMAEAVYRERLLGISITDKDKKEILEFLNSGGKDSDIYLLIYGNIFLMNLEKEPDAAEKYYRQVKTVLQTFSKDVPKEEIKSICVYLQNYCLAFINRGHKNYLREFLEVINLRIEKNVLLEEGRLNPQHYKNIAGVAIMLNEITWAENFITEFRSKLPDNFRNDYYHYVSGQLFYHKKNFIVASKHLNEACHNKEDVYFGFSVKKLLLKIGFESNESPAVIESYMDAYRKHLERYRHKIGENAPILEKFFKYFRYLEKARDDSREMEIFLNRLKEEENFADKDWLMNMAQLRLKKPALKPLSAVSQ